MRKALIPKYEAQARQLLAEANNKHPTDEEVALKAQELLRLKRKESASQACMRRSSRQLTYVPFFSQEVKPLRKCTKG